jgi:hypothetical protein
MPANGVDNDQKEDIADELEGDGFAMEGEAELINLGAEDGLDPSEARLLTFMSDCEFMLVSLRFIKAPPQSLMSIDQYPRPSLMGRMLSTGSRSRNSWMRQIHFRGL